MAKKGFFRTSQLASKKIKTTPNYAECNKCKLHLTCKNPYMKPTGRGEIKMLHVAQAPGAVEDRKGEQLVGTAGKFYKRCLKKAGIDLEAGLKTNANICYPPRDSKPTKTQIKACHPNLRKTIDDFNPHVIVALGDNAIDSLTMHKSNKSLVGGITTCRGFVIPDKEYKAWICPTFHPSYVNRETSPEITEKLFIDDLSHAAQMLDVPLPYYIDDDEESKVEILKHPKETILWLQKMMGMPEQKFMAAFDYETTGLKPQREEMKIYTCSISLGPDHAVAFPFFDDHQEFLINFSRFLATTDIMKIAANLKYEDYWSNVKLGMNVNGWFFDTMLGKHYIDNRPKITSLTRMNYFDFGIEPYDTYISGYLKSENGRGNELNNIHKADLKDLLVYNGMDSMTEFRQAIVQMDLIGIPYKEYYNTEKNPSAQEIAPQYFVRR